MAGGTCHGRGLVECKACAGTGKQGEIVWGKYACPTCRGTGLLQCPACRGTSKAGRR